MRRYLFGAALLVLLACVSAVAQQTTGTVTGRVVDQQSAAVPGVTVTAKSPSTGFIRSEVTDVEGVYRLTALPVGIYEVTAELQGFATVSKKDVEVNVSTTVSIDFSLQVAALAETVNVTGATPLIETRTSSVGGVVDVKRIESLPLNGRQFANLAATIPGVGLRFHTDPTKSTQYSPQINGGNGRNVNYQIDGGDNNDDTVGGLLQAVSARSDPGIQLPVTQRFKAEYGRSNGGVMNIVTKSGTNLPHGQLLRVVPRQEDECAEGNREVAATTVDRSRAIPAEPVRRQLRWAHPEGQGALLRGVRADATGHVPGRQRRRDSSRRRTASSRRPIARTCSRQGDGQPQRRAVPVGALRLQQQFTAVRRDAQRTFGQLGGQHEQVPLDQPESQLGHGRRRS